MPLCAGVLRTIWVASGTAGDAARDGIPNSTTGSSSNGATRVQSQGSDKLKKARGRVPERRVRQRTALSRRGSGAFVRDGNANAGKDSWYLKRGEGFPLFIYLLRFCMLQRQGKNSVLTLKQLCLAIWITSGARKTSDCSHCFNSKIPASCKGSWKAPVNSCNPVPAPLLQKGICLHALVLASESTWTHLQLVFKSNWNHGLNLALKHFLRVRPSPWTRPRRSLPQHKPLWMTETNKNFAYHQKNLYNPI